MLLLFLFVVWAALVFWTYADARRRIDDPMLVICATAASLFPFVGTIVYVIVRPPEFLDDVRLRELEMHAAESRLHQLDWELCPNCDYEIRSDYLRCPSCLRKLKESVPRVPEAARRARGRSARSARPRSGGIHAVLHQHAADRLRRPGRRRRTQETEAIDMPPRV